MYETLITNLTLALVLLLFALVAWFCVRVLMGWARCELTFQHPVNGYIERANAAPIWVLLFGCFYFAYKGVWKHAALGLLAGLVTAGLSWLAYPFFTQGLMRHHYLSKGWHEVP